LAWGYAYPSPSLADPGGSSALVAAVQWLQGTLLGTVATTVAVICVATIGLMMLSGRVDLRRGASVVIGCFILFGASGIAAGIGSFAGAGPVPAEAAFDADLWVPPPLPQPPSAAPADPYAGAAVPTRCTAEEALRLTSRCVGGGRP
jgi:type IV secretory pathway VirB2 component (pilin)